MHTAPKHTTPKGIAAMTVSTGAISSASARSARDILGPSSLGMIESQSLAGLIVDPKAQSVNDERSIAGEFR
jgi:hypothetical protein